MPEEFRTIGKSALRKEGIPKVTGQAAYVDDLRFENCLYGRTVRSTAPHGIIREIRFQPGVQWDEFTIVLPEDIPGNNAVTLIDAEQPFLAHHEIQHLAEPIALIGHPDKRVLDEALHQIEVDVEELPAIFTMEDGLRSRNHLSSLMLSRTAIPPQSGARPHLIVEETYRTGAQEHLYIEPQGVVATARSGRHHDLGIDAVSLLRPAGGCASIRSSP